MWISTSRVPSRLVGYSGIAWMFEPTARSPGTRPGLIPRCAPCCSATTPRDLPEIHTPCPPTALACPSEPPHPRSGKRGRRSTLGYIALIVFLFLAGLGVIGAVAAVSGYNYLASDLRRSRDADRVPAPRGDRSSTTGPARSKLARFGEFKREVVDFRRDPADSCSTPPPPSRTRRSGRTPDSTRSASSPPALDSLRGDSRGASTITQQLVRARLLDPELVQDPERTIERKLKEIIQSIRVTQAFPGEEGKQEIITAYLNQNYYGNQSYGVKAAVRDVLRQGSRRRDVTPAEAAIIAALPKSPSNYDLVRNAVERCEDEVAEGEDCPTAKRT